MTSLVVNILLMIVWGVLTGSLEFLNLLLGFVLGYGILWLIQPLIGGPNSYFRRVYAWIRLIAEFHYELFVSSVQVVWDVLTPTHLADPAIVEVPLDVKTDAGILLVTNLISLTPGTLSLDVSPDRKTLTIHAMFGEDPEELIHQLKTGMERLVIEAVEGDE